MIMAKSGDVHVHDYQRAKKRVSLEYRGKYKNGHDVLVGYYCAGCKHFQAADILERKVV